MKPKRKVEKAIQRKLRFAAHATFREQLFADMMDAQSQSKETAPALHEAGIRRTIMHSRTAKFASMAAAIAIAAIAVSLLPKLTPPAYAIEQTVEALQNVRFLHLVQRDEAGQIEDERWIEIGADGFQVHYRQENGPPHNFGVIEDGDSTAVYRHDKQAVIVYDRNERQYQWVGELGKAFEDLRQNGKILEEDSTYQGQPAHKVWWPYLSAECYVDPDSKLPLAIGDMELSYEVPEAGTFEIVFPEGYATLDKRPGAETGPVPQWLLEEERAEQNASECFHQATRALADGEYAEAAELFEYVTEHQPGRNWAWFWLGSAYYELEQYDLAIEKFTKVLEMFKAYGAGGDEPVGYCNYARGLAYARLGMDAEAEADLQACLPAMIRTLRIPSSGKMFEYADNPLVRSGYKPGDQEIVVKMVNRLRLITGQNFGYDAEATNEENEAAIAAWEQWLANDGTIRFTAEADLVAVPSP